MDVVEIVDKGYLESREYHIISKHGGKIPVRMTSSLVRDADGKPMGMVRVGKEIIKSNLIEAEERKARRNEH